ncbi:hypothetical protein [Aureivirga marina]|uniref:hypothetical protein n=1 Tax=Aureivirga marina TaxID=1182451 RepID=UPI001E44ED0C|nr:hypothetical protein [Aureivirga marina]
MKHINKFFVFAISLVMLSSLISCGGDSNRNTAQTTKWEKTPVDKLIVKYMDVPTYSIILADMNSEKEEYFHKYKIILEKATGVKDSLDIESQTTGWEKVSPTFFENNINNLGMALVTKTDGKLDKIASPAGFNNYVGNPKYGEWKTNSSGESFWSFYGKYALLRDILGFNSYPVYRTSWYDYDRNYRGRSSYYGSGKYSYGTKSTRNTSSTWASKPSSFKSKVRSQVKRSAAASSSRSYNANSRYSKSNKSTRSSSRYNSSSSSRSRGGGFGK